MDTSLLYRLACILLLPLLPAFLLYTKLPSKTTVDGPFRGLNLKLSGAFSGYFLLVLLAISIMLITDRNRASDLETANKQLQTQLDSLSVWTIEGQLQADTLPDTKIFVSGNSSLHNRLFNVRNVPSPLQKGKINTALCFYNPRAGRKYKIVNINENFPEMLRADSIRIDRTGKTIHIEKPVAFQ